MDPLPESEPQDWWTNTELSNAQYIPLVVLGTLSSTLSLIGSSCVIYMTCHNNNLKSKVMHRLLFSLSIADVLASLSFLLSPFLIPSYLALPGAVGNHASCTAAGFFWMGSVLLGCFYNCYLSLYYLLVVRWSFRERDFTKHWEIVAHVVAVLVPLTLNLVAVTTQSINPVPILNGICSYSAIPWGCNDGGSVCLRSRVQLVEGLIITTAVLEVAISLVSFLGTFWVWKTVSSAIQRSNAHRFQGDHDEHNDERLHQVSTQAILYSLAYFNTVFWATITVCIIMTIPIEQLDAQKGEVGYYTLAILFCIFYPLQGFMNFFIFERVKVQHWIKADPDRSRLWIYYQVLQSNQPTKTKSTITSTTTSTKRPTKSRLSNHDAVVECVPEQQNPTNDIKGDDFHQEGSFALE